MPFQIYRRENPDTLAKAITAGTEGFIQGRTMRRQREEDALANAYKLARIDELRRKSEALNAKAPEGFVNIGGEIHKDPRYLNPLQQAQARYANARAGQGTALPPSRQNLKDKRTENIIQTFANDQASRENIAQAEAVLPRLPSGLGGYIKTEYMKRFDAENPLLEDWQKVKSVMTDAQLLNTARTKGAISDREMELFAKAAANDDLASVKRIRPVIEKLKRFIDANERGLISSYRKIYGEDPLQWQEMRGTLPSRKTELSSMSDDELKALAGL